jgi:sigma-E factor negative regulatory protein RseB
MRHGLVLAAVGCAVAVAGAPVAAAPAERQAYGAADDAYALLQRAALAARNLSYHGTQLVSFWSDAGSTSAVLDVTHVGGEGLLVRVRPTPQNPGGALYEDENGDLLGFATGALTLLAAHYEIAVEGSGEVAGRPAVVVAVRRPATSPAARFWLDRQTALPLRREVLDTDGKTVRETAFLDVVVGDADVPMRTKEAAQMMPAVLGDPVSDVGALASDGWEVPGNLASGLELVDARRHGDAVQLTYSDGVSTVSVFEQHGRLDTDSVEEWRETKVAGHEVYVQSGFPLKVVWSGHGVVYTVVAECPSACVSDVVGALPHGNPGPSVVSRIGHGVKRVGSWINPFA